MQGFIIMNPYDYIDTVNATKGTLSRPQSIEGKCKKELMAGEELKRISGWIMDLQKTGLKRRPQDIYTWARTQNYRHFCLSFFKLLFSFLRPKVIYVNSFCPDLLAWGWEEVSAATVLNPYILPTTAQIWWTKYSFSSLQKTFPQDSGSNVKHKRGKLYWRKKRLNGTELWEQNSWMLFIQNKQRGLDEKHWELLREWVRVIVKNEKEIRSRISWNNLEMGYVRAGEASASGQEQRHDGMLRPLLEVICPFEQ